MIGSPAVDAIELNLPLTTVGASVGSTPLSEGDAALVSGPFRMAACRHRGTRKRVIPIGLRVVGLALHGAQNRHVRAVQTDAWPRRLGDFTDRSDPTLSRRYGGAPRGP